jgi:cytidine deaminase
MKPAHEPEPPDVEVDEADLLHRARNARRHAYVPYSGFHVGAAVLSASGTIFTGANVENAAYPLGMCAERTAVGTMVATGDLGPIVAVAVVGDGDDPCTPCGGCRQVINEFGPGATMLASGDDGRPLRTTLAELLPHAFGPMRLIRAGQDDL